MGDNATGTLGGRFPFPENFVNFSSQNGVLWCIMRVLLLRFMNAVFRIPAEGKKIKHLSKYWGVVDTGRPLQVKYWGSRPLRC